MLSSRNLEDETFEELMKRAKIQIPLYSSEWTNFNNSDPGITTLENLSAFSILQQSYINEVREEVQRKLLKLAGYEEKDGKSARVLLKAENVSQALLLPNDQKFMAGNVCFETNHAIELAGHHITAVYTKCQQGILDGSILLDAETRTGWPVFGSAPKAGNAVYFVLDGLPEDGSDIIFYVGACEKYPRNMMAEGQTNTFAKIKWECFTEKGYQKIKYKDTTGGFFHDGELRFQLSREKAVWSDKFPKQGYIIRGTLVWAEYDIAPEIDQMEGLLFEVWQKDTKSFCYTFPGKNEIAIYSDALEDGYVRIYCREQGEEHFHLYEETKDEKQKGRFFQMKREDYGMYRFSFLRDRYGFGPGKYSNAVKVVIYSEEMMRQYDLGTLYGYDNQQIVLPVKHIVPKSFSLLLMKKTEDQEEYMFVRPGKMLRCGFCYTLDEEEGKITILDAGDYIDAKVLLGTVAVTLGEEGNILAGNVFEPIGYESAISFKNPAAGTGGRNKETLAQLILRFSHELEHANTAVTTEDYERIILQTPELCIHKVKAFMDYKENLVKIAVKPYSDQPFPKLSQQYRERMKEYLEKRRILTTSFRILQPMYVRVDVNATIRVKKHFSNSRKMIEEELDRQIDFRKSAANFGEVLSYSTIFCAIETLECVEAVLDCTISPDKSGIRNRIADDFQAVDNGLFYSGYFNLNISTYIG